MKALAAGDDRLRVSEAKQLAHVSASMIYRWGQEGRFGWFTVKQRNKERGIRYIDKRSFLSWLELQREDIHYGLPHPMSQHAKEGPNGNSAN